MSQKQINQLPAGIANVNAVVAADNADLSTTEKITLGDIAKLGTEAPGSKNIYVDNGRTDNYTEDGSIMRPYKTIRAAFAGVGDAADNTEFHAIEHRFYCFRIAPGVYDEASGGDLQVPRRIKVVLDFSGGATIVGNLVRDLSGFSLGTAASNGFVGTADDDAWLVLNGMSGRPGGDSGELSQVGIVGNITMIGVSSGNFSILYLLGCAVNVIEYSGGGNGHFFADHNATWDTLKRVDAGNSTVTVYLSNSSNSSGVGTGGNMIGKLFIANVTDYVWMSDKSIFTTSSAYLRLGANVNVPSYSERRISSFTRTNNVATVTLSENHGFSLKTLRGGYIAEQYILINGVTEDASFNTSTWGAKVVAYPSATTIQYESTGPDVTEPVSVASGKLIRGTFFGNVASNSFVTLGADGRGEIDAAHTMPAVATDSELGAGSSMIRGIANAVLYSNPLTSWSAGATQVKNTLFIHSNGYQYRVTSPIGRTGATEPVWPTTIGETVSDGNVTWVTEELGFMPGEVQAYNVQSKLEKLCNAKNIYYRNADSGLTATNVKAAIDELDTSINELTPRKVHNVTQDTYFDTIWEAVAAAAANDVVTVAPGTYREFLYIDKPLTLRGPNYGKRGDDPTRGPEAVLEYSHAAVGTYAIVIYCDSDDVTVEGFDIRYPDSLLRPGHNAAVTFTDDGDLVTCTGHGFANGDVIMFSARATTTGISTYTYYFVINATENTFQLASTAGGAALPLTNDGTGTIFGASGSLLFGYARNNLVLRNNRWYSSELPIYIYFNNPFGNKTGGVIEGNYIDCGPFVNAGSSRAIYCSDLAVTIQDNVIVNSAIGIQVSQYTTPAASVVQRNKVEASGCGLYNNAHYNGGGTVTWTNNTVTLAPNDRLGLKQLVAGRLTATTQFQGIWGRSTGINSTGTAPNVVLTNNVVDLTLDPTKAYNSTVLRGLLFQDVHKTVTTTINNNSFVGWTVAARSQATAGAAVASSIDANLSNNWWGTATLSKLVLESTVASGSIVVSSVLAGKTAGDGTVLLRGFGVPLSSDVNYDNTTSGLAATNVKAAIDALAGEKITNAGNVASIRSLTQEQYDAIETPDPNTLYIIAG